MKFQVQDITVNDYNSAFEIIKDKVRTKIHELNKPELLNNIKEYPHKHQFLTDGITITIESSPSDNLKELDDNSIVSTLTFAFKGQKAEIYEIIKNPKEKKKNK